MKEYDCIVIGAGIAGLFSAFKLSSLGEKVLVLEKQPIPGGYATTFARNGFIFESSLHCVDGLGLGGEIREFLEEYNLDKKIEFIPLKDFARIIYPEHDFIANFSKDDFILYLKQQFPAEKENMDRLFRAFDKFYKQFDRFSKSKLPNWLNFALCPLIYPTIITASYQSAEQLISRYIKDGKLKVIITDIWRFLGLPPSRLSAFYFLIVFRGYYYQPTCNIKGGFTKLFNLMIEEMKKQGSIVRFNSTVKKITTKNGKRIKSVITDKNEEFRAKAIISNANCFDTLINLMDNEAVKKKYESKLEGMEKSISAFQVYLGLSVPAKNLGMIHSRLSVNTSYNHDDNFNYSVQSDYDNCILEITDHAQVDPSLVPDGRGSLMIMTYDNYSHWKGLSKEEYKKHKLEVADKLIQRVEKFLPGLAKYIEVKEIATPLTMERYTLSPEGSIYGFAQNVAQASINRLPQRTAVKGLILAGAWTFPGGGMHGCFVSGMEAADLASRCCCRLLKLFRSQ